MTTGRSRSAPGDPAASAGGRRLLFLVSRDAREHYEYLKRAFEGEKDVEVMLDRRRSDRRRRTIEPPIERRRRERRLRPHAEDRLRALGWSIVAVYPVR